MTDYLVTDKVSIRSSGRTPGKGKKMERLDSHKVDKFPGISLEEAEIVAVDMGCDGEVRNVVFGHCGARGDDSLYFKNWYIFNLLTYIFGTMEEYERPFPEDYPPDVWQRAMDFYHRAEAVERAEVG